MSNTDTAPAEVACAASVFAGVLHPREVPLGGPRAIRVRGGTGMDVPPHPHTGLQTASWLFSGGVEHRGSAGGARHGAAG
jgi:quercetin 2,3-dioxygenase